MSRQWFSAVGYLSIFLMPALFLIGAIADKPWLAFGVVVLVFPLARVAFGALPAAGTPEWNETVATVLDRLPLAYTATLPVCVLAGLTLAAEPLGGDGVALLGFGLSLWMTLLFGTCVAHELIHRRDKTSGDARTRARRHLRLPGAGHGAPCAPRKTRRHASCRVPLKDESVWQFAGRRMWRVGSEHFGSVAPIWSLRAQMPNLVRTRIALLATALTWASFGAIGGWPGAGLYSVMMIGVAFGIQLITYIQHWGLGDDSIPDRIGHGRGWEEDCRFQAWVTLSISLHDEHHRDSRRPYYRLDLAPDSPRLPAGYVLLMFASLIPWVWRRVMEPAHQHWLATPGSPLSAGRRLTCFGLHELRVPTSH